MRDLPTVWFGQKDKSLTQIRCARSSATLAQLLAHKILLPSSVRPRKMNRAFPSDVSDHLRYRVLRRYSNHHLHMVGQQMSFFEPTLFLAGAVHQRGRHVHLFGGTKPIW